MGSSSFRLDTTRLLCPLCAQTIPVRYTNRRSIENRTFLVNIRSCSQKKCPLSSTRLHPEIEGFIVRPKSSRYLETTFAVGSYISEMRRTFTQAADELSFCGASPSVVRKLFSEFQSVANAKAKNFDWQTVSGNGCLAISTRKLMRDSWGGDGQFAYLEFLEDTISRQVLTGRYFKDSVASRFSIDHDNDDLPIRLEEMLKEVQEVCRVPIAPEIEVNGVLYNLGPEYDRLTLRRNSTVSNVRGDVMVDLNR